MRTKDSASSSQGGLEPFDPEQDHYPTLVQVLRRIMQEDDIPEGPVERVEVTCLASGEATWRVWAARAEEEVGGYYTRAEFK